MKHIPGFLTRYANYTGEEPFEENKQLIKYTKFDGTTNKHAYPLCLQVSVFFYMYTLKRNRQRVLQWKKLIFVTNYFQEIGRVSFT